MLGILERASEGKAKRVRATVVSDRKKATIQDGLKSPERSKKRFQDLQR